MDYKPIIVVAGEPNSIFSEIFFKSLNYKKFKSPIILIASQKLIKLQMKKFKVKKKIRLIEYLYFEKYKLDNKKINLIKAWFKKSSYKKLIKPEKDVKQEQKPINKISFFEWLIFLSIIKP